MTHFQLQTNNQSNIVSMFLLDSKFSHGVTTFGILFFFRITNNRDRRLVLPLLPQNVTRFSLVPFDIFPILEVVAGK